MTKEAYTLSTNVEAGGDLRQALRDAAQIASNWQVVHRPTTKSTFLQSVQNVQKEVVRLEKALSEASHARVSDDSPQSDAVKGLVELRSNRRLLRQAALAVSENPSILGRLPRILYSDGKEELRVGVAAHAYLQAVHGQFTVETLANFVHEIQAHDPLLLDELWHLVAFLQFSLLEEIVDTAFEILEMKTSQSEPMLARYIKSLQVNSTIDLVALIEPLIQFDATLKKDPSSAYATMDFESRERYRERVAFLARHSDSTEAEVANAALLLSQEYAATSSGESRKQARQRHIGFYLVDQGLPQLKNRIGFHGPWTHRALEFVRTNGEDFYITGVHFLTVVVLCAILFPLLPRTSTLLGVLIAALVVWIPAMQVAVELVNFTVNIFFQPNPLPKLDFSAGIPATFATLVAVPSLLLNEKQVENLVTDLEVRFLANRSPNLYFALLTDLPDSAGKSQEHESHPLLNLAMTLIRELNIKYDPHGTGAFLLLHRRRVFNTRQGVWMGWERKRGKLMDLNKLLAGEFDAFPIKAGTLRPLPLVRYVLTLDSDTQLPRGTAARMVGAIAHPLNQAVIDAKSRIVTAGYGILQPRIGITTRSTSQSRLASIYSGQNGFDIYTRAVSDPYQDLFGEGIFTGKGIYEVGTLHAVLDMRFPRNVLLSHDLIEGAYSRVALAQDIELVDDYPSHYSAYSRRKHRWVRGDWQIAQWMFSRVQEESGRWVPNPISGMSRWKIFDNLRRSLVDVSLCSVFLLGWLFLPGGPLYWTIAPIALLCVPSAVQLLVGLVRCLSNWKKSSVIDVWEAAGRTFALIALNLAFLLHQTLLSLDAIVRAVVRRSITGEHLLEWETAEQAETSSESTTPVDQYLAAMPVVSAVLGICLWFFALQRSSVFVAAPILAMWALSPVVILWINRPASRSKPLQKREEESLMRHALQIWRFFHDFGGEKHNYLIPDNVEEKGFHEAARVSPTNIGLVLNARLVALELGFLTVPEFADLTHETLATVERLDKYRGHLFNWYSTVTLQSLDADPVVSTVDSGNLAASLITIHSGAKDWLRRSFVGPQVFQGVAAYWKSPESAHAIARISKQKSMPGSGSTMDEWVTWLREVDTLLSLDTDPMSFDQEEYLWRREAADRVRASLTLLQDYCPWVLPEHRDILGRTGPEPALEYSLNITELIPAASGLQLSLEQKINSPGADPSSRLEAERFLGSMTLAVSNLRALESRLRAIVGNVERMINDTDFSFLVNQQRQMLSIGYDVNRRRLHGPCYDMMASEARIATFLAIAQGDLALRGWSRLSRKHVHSEGESLLLSWTGTMFEYMMPALWMRSYPGTLIMRSQVACVRVQRAFAKALRIPWGISESGFAKTDDNGHYQYRAFGIPSLSLSTDAMAGPVVSPYSTFLALAVDGGEVLANLERMAAAGWRGRYGLYEATDYSHSTANPELVREWMAHHLGMSLLAITNALRDNIVQRWFHSNVIVRSTELILQEVPANRASLKGWRKELD